MPGMKFTKMHGLGNDYVFVDVSSEPVQQMADLAHRVSDRHLGIGSDGLILIGPSEVADVRMEMYNADGSRAQMCGNGIRCVAKYAVDRGRVSGPELTIETDAGIKHARCELEGGAVSAVRIDMGKPSLAASDLPTTVDRDRLIEHPLRVNGEAFHMTCVSMGNPHAVIFVDKLHTVDLVTLGPLIECADIFPERINVHFVRVDASDRVTVRTWERGSGATRACGTGACAVCVASAETQRTGRRITTVLPGGELQIDWAGDDHVYMTGPAVEAFSGDWPR